MSPIEMCLPSPGASRVLVMSYFLDSMIANSLNYILTICELFCI